MELATTVQETARMLIGAAFIVPAVTTVIMGALVMLIGAQRK